MPRDNQQHKSLTRRAAILGGTQVMLTAALAGRLYQLQVLEKDRYRVMADENRINLRLDRNIGCDSYDGGIVWKQRRFAAGAAIHLDLGMRLGLEAFDHHEVDRRHLLQ